MIKVFINTPNDLSYFLGEFKIKDIKKLLKFFENDVYVYGRLNEEYELDCSYFQLYVPEVNGLKEKRETKFIIALRPVEK